MTQRSLAQSDFEDLSAHLDGQLDAGRAEAVEELVRTDPAWGDQWNRLQAVDRALDAYDVPAPPSDLNDRILLETVGFEDLSAHLDGQLSAGRAAAVEELIRTDAAWGQAWDRLRTLDADLDAYDIPAPPTDLADRIVNAVNRKTRNRKLAFRLWAPLAGAAAAAAIIIIAMVLSAGEAPDANNQKKIANNPTGKTRTPNVLPKDKLPRVGDEVTRAIVEHLDFVRDLDVLEDFETLEAIERLEVASLES